MTSSTPYLPNELWLKVISLLRAEDVRAATVTGSQLAQVGDVVQTDIQMRLAGDLVEYRGLPDTLQGIGAELNLASTDMRDFWTEGLRNRCVEITREVEDIRLVLANLSERLMGRPVANADSPSDYSLLADQLDSMDWRLQRFHERLAMVPVASELPHSLETFRIAESTALVDETDAELCEQEFEQYVEKVADTGKQFSLAVWFGGNWEEWLCREELDRTSPEATVSGLLQYCRDIARLVLRDVGHAGSMLHRAVESFLRKHDKIWGKIIDEVMDAPSKRRGLQGEDSHKTQAGEQPADEGKQDNG